MKTFKQFLNEAETSELKEMIERDCAQFLRESKSKGFLYRGIQHNPDDDDHHVTDIDGNRLVYIVKSVRADRKPRDTKPSTHKNLNNWFNKKFGWNVRSEGVFVFGENFHEDIVKGYGEPHIIFPIGELKYVWSPNITDLYVAMEGEGLSYSDITEEAISKWLDTLNFKDTKLTDAIDDGSYPSEIILKCDKYYAFPIEYRDELKKSLGVK